MMLPFRKPTARTSMTTGGLVTLAALLANTLLTSKKGRPGSGQSLIYRLAQPRGILLTALAFTADILAIPRILRNKPALTEVVLAAINTDNIRRSDQIALRQNIADINFYKTASDNLLRLLVGAFALVFFDPALRRNAGRLFLLYAYVHAISYTTYTFSPLGPAFRNKYRPAVYYNLLTNELRSLGNNQNSGYSGHTSSAATAAFFLAKVYADHHPELSRSARFLLYVIAGLPPLGVGYLRMKALKHFPSDVWMAIGMGALAGVGIPELHKQRLT